MPFINVNKIACLNCFFLWSSKKTTEKAVGLQYHCVFKLILFSQQVHFWALKMFTSEIWNTVPRLMVLLLFLMMAELVSLHQCQVDSPLRYISFSISSMYSTMNVFSLVSAFQLAFYFKFCSSAMKLKFSNCLGDIRTRLYFMP